MAWRETVRVLAIFAAWDWLVAVSTRLLAADSYLAVPYAVAITAIWWWGVGIAGKRPWVWAPALLGAASGTALGLVWP